MNLERILERIELRLAALKMTASAASKKAGKSDAIRNIKRAVKNGDRGGVSTATLEALAPVLQTTAGWLIGDDDAISPSGGSARLRSLMVAGFLIVGAEPDDSAYLADLILEAAEKPPVRGLRGNADLGRQLRSSIRAIRS